MSTGCATEGNLNNCPNFTSYKGDINKFCLWYPWYSGVSQGTTCIDLRLVSITSKYGPWSQIRAYSFVCKQTEIGLPVTSVTKVKGQIATSVTFVNFISCKIDFLNTHYFYKIFIILSIMEKIVWILWKFHNFKAFWRWIFLHFRCHLPRFRSQCILIRHYHPMVSVWVYTIGMIISLDSHIIP